MHQEKETIQQLKYNPLAPGNVGKHANKAISKPEFLSVLKKSLSKFVPATISSKSVKLSPAQMKQNLQEVAEYFTLVFVIALSVGYYVTFKCYHDSMQKHAQL